MPDRVPMLHDAPSTALAEVLYVVSRDTEIRGIPLSGSPDAVRQALLANGPVSLTPTAEPELDEFGRIVDGFSIHDAVVVVSHRARDTEAVITSDATIRNADVETIWD